MGVEAAAWCGERCARGSLGVGLVVRARAPLRWPGSLERGAALGRAIGDVSMQSAPRNSRCTTVRGGSRSGSQMGIVRVVLHVTGFAPNAEIKTTASIVLAVPLIHWFISSHVERQGDRCGADTSCYPSRLVGRCKCRLCCGLRLARECRSTCDWRFGCTASGCDEKALPGRQDAPWNISSHAICRAWHSQKSRSQSHGLTQSRDLACSCRKLSLRSGLYCEIADRVRGLMGSAMAHPSSCTTQFCSGLAPLPVQRPPTEGRLSFELQAQHVEQARPGASSDPRHLAHTILDRHSALGCSRGDQLARDTAHVANA